MIDSKVELERKIEVLETRLAELKSRLKDIETAEQHEAIDHLDEYLQEIDQEYDGIRSFWPLVVRELQDWLKSPKS